MGHTGTVRDTQSKWGSWKVSLQIQETGTTVVWFRMLSSSHWNLMLYDQSQIENYRKSDHLRVPAWRLSPTPLSPPSWWRWRLDCSLWPPAHHLLRAEGLSLMKTKNYLSRYQIHHPSRAAEQLRSRGRTRIKTHPTRSWGKFSIQRKRHPEKSMSRIFWAFGLEKKHLRYTLEIRHENQS